MNIFSKNIILLLIIFSGPQLLARTSTTVLSCTIEFPQAIKSVPQVYAYQSGERFSSETDTEGKKACFTIPVDKTTDQFCLLITKDLEYETDGNTVKYFKVNMAKSYKFYHLHLIKAPRKRYKLPSEMKEKEQKDHWEVTPMELPESGIIPDETIIVRFNAEYIDSLKFDNGFEFPSIIVKNDILELIGSQQALEEYNLELTLSSLDYNPLHAPVKAHTKLDQQKIIVAMSDRL